jgi:hypothetical protein
VLKDSTLRQTRWNLSECNIAEEVLSENEPPDYKKLWAGLMRPIYAHAVLVWDDVVTEGGWLGGCVMPNRRGVKERLGIL